MSSLQSIENFLQAILYCLMSFYLLPRVFSALPVLGSRFYWAAHQFSAQRWARHHSSEKRKRPKRQEKLAYLRNLGMSKFNNTVQGKIRDSIAQPGGLQVPCKPKTKKKSHLDYRKCPGCLGLYSKRTLWKHQRRCLRLWFVVNVNLLFHWKIHLVWEGKHRNKCEGWWESLYGPCRLLNFLIDQQRPIKRYLDIIYLN